MQCKKKNLNQGVSIIYALEFCLISFSGIVMNWCWAIRGPLVINSCRQAMPMLKNVIDVMCMYFTYHILKFLERIINSIMLCFYLILYIVFIHSSYSRTFEELEMNMKKLCNLQLLNLAKGFDIVYTCLTCINIKYSISQRHPIQSHNQAFIICLLSQ